MGVATNSRAPWNAIDFLIYVAHEIQAVLLPGPLPVVRWSSVHLPGYAAVPRFGEPARVFRLETCPPYLLHPQHSPGVARAGVCHALRRAGSASALNAGYPHCAHN